MSDGRNYAIIKYAWRTNESKDMKSCVYFAGFEDGYTIWGDATQAQMFTLSEVCDFIKDHEDMFFFGVTMVFISPEVMSKLKMAKVEKEKKICDTPFSMDRASLLGIWKTYHDYSEVAR